MTQAKRVALPVDSLCGESVAVLYYADQKPLQGPAALLDWRLDGQLTRLLASGAIQGRAGEQVLLQNNGKLAADWALFVGGGKWHGLCRETHAALVRHMVKVARRAGFKNIALAFMPHAEIDLQILQRQVADALAAEGAGIESCLFSFETGVSAA